MGVLTAKERYGIMTRDPWLHYISAKRDYDRAKAEADVEYTVTRGELFAKLVSAVGQDTAERIHRDVRRNSGEGNHSAREYRKLQRRKGNGGMEHGDGGS